MEEYKILFWYLPGGTEENQVKSVSISLSPIGDSNPGPSEYEARPKRL
jgi:hypothetical protein